MTSRYSKVLPPTPNESPASPYAPLPRLDGQSDKHARRRSKPTPAANGSGSSKPSSRRSSRAPIPIPAPHPIPPGIPEITIIPPSPKDKPRVKFNLGEIGRRVSAGIILARKTNDKSASTPATPTAKSKPKPEFIDTATRLHAGPGGIFEPDFEHPVLPAFLRTPQYARPGYWDAHLQWHEYSTSSSETSSDGVPGVATPATPPTRISVPAVGPSVPPTRRPPQRKRSLSTLEEEQPPPVILISPRGSQSSESEHISPERSGPSPGSVTTATSWPHYVSAPAPAPTPASRSPLSPLSESPTSPFPYSTAQPQQPSRLYPPTQPSFQPEPEPSPNSFRWHLNRLRRLRDQIFALPWRSRTHVTAAYIPASATPRQLPPESWYTARVVDPSKNNLAEKSKKKREKIPRKISRPVVQAVDSRIDSRYEPHPKQTMSRRKKVPRVESSASGSNSNSSRRRYSRQGRSPRHDRRSSVSPPTTFIGVQGAKVEMRLKPGVPLTVVNPDIDIQLTRDEGTGWYVPMSPPGRI